MRPSDQDVLDVAYEALAVQHAPPSVLPEPDLLRDCEEVTQTPRALYRYGDLRCAIGMSLPDPLYHPQMEGMTVGQLLDTFADVANHFSLCRRAFLEALQGEYDLAACDHPEGGHWWVQSITLRLRTLAHRWNLALPRAGRDARVGVLFVTWEVRHANG